MSVSFAAMVTCYIAVALPRLWSWLQLPPLKHYSWLRWSWLIAAIVVGAALVWVGWDNMHLIVTNDGPDGFRCVAVKNTAAFYGWVKPLWWLWVETLGPMVFIFSLISMVTHTRASYSLEAITLALFLLWLAPLVMTGLWGVGQADPGALCYVKYLDKL